MLLKQIFFVVLTLLLNIFSNGQTTKTDSLEFLLERNQAADTVRVDLLIKLASDYGGVL